MTKDRLQDLQKTRRNHEVPNDVDDTDSHPTTIDIDDELNVTAFLRQIDLLRSLISEIDVLAGDVKQIHLKMLDPMADPKLEQQFDDKRNEIKKLADNVSTKLKKMEEIQESENDKTNAQWRLKESQIVVVIRRFRDTMNQYNHDCNLHLEKCKNIVKRELELAGNKRTDEEVTDVVENGFPGTHNFSIMYESQKAIQDLNYIEARQRDIEKLEISIKEVHAMFVDLALLISTQGAMIDNIEHNVSKAADFIAEGAKDVKQTTNLNDAAVKKKIILYIILAALVVILILIFIAYLNQKKIIG